MYLLYMGALLHSALLYLPRNYKLTKHILKYCTDYGNILVAMDANARNMLWDDGDCGYGVSRKTGDVLLEALLDNQTEVLNDGSHTFHESNYSAALDLTVIKGLQTTCPVKWTVLDDDINSDHSLILTSVGNPVYLPRLKRRTGKTWIGTSTISNQHASCRIY